MWRVQINSDDDGVTVTQIRKIRRALGLSQAALGERLDMTQGNVSAYERGQQVPPPVAERLINLAVGMGVPLTFDHVYREMDIPSPTSGVRAVSQVNDPAEGVHRADGAVADQQRDAGAGPVVNPEKIGLADAGVVGAVGGAHVGSVAVDDGMVHQ